MTPKLVVEPMNKWQSRILHFVANLVGLRGGSVAWFTIEDLDFTKKFEVTINDLKRMHEEDEMNKQTEKETGE